MRVKELIKKLQELPEREQNYVVIIRDDQLQTHFEVGHIGVSNAEYYDTEDELNSTMETIIIE